MRSERGSQTDLFTVVVRPPALRSEVRTKLGSLLRVLLTEAAGQARSEAKDSSEPCQKGNGDDQNRG